MAEKKEGSTIPVRKGKVHRLIKTDRGLFPFSVLRKYETEARSERIIEDEQKQMMQYGLVPHPFRTKSLLDLQENCTYFDACVRQVAKDVIGHGWGLKPVEEPEKEGEESDTQKTERERITEFLDDVNEEDDTVEQVFERIIIDWGVIGWWSLEVARVPEQIEGIWQVPAHQIYVHKDRDRYCQVVNQKRKWFRRFGKDVVISEATGNEVSRGTKHAREMIFVRNYYAQSGFYGAPNILSGVGAVTAYIGIRNYNIAFFENYGVPAALVTLEGEWEEDSMKLINDFLDVEIKRSDNQHKTLVIELPSGEQGKLNWEQLSVDVKEGSFRFLRKDVRDEILVGYRMPPYRIGIAEVGSLGGSTAKEALPNYNQSIIQPLKNETAAVITKRLLWDGMGCKSFRFHWNEMDTRDIDAMTDRWVKLFGMAAINDNYIRNELGLKVVEHGEQYFISAAYLPLGEETVEMMEKRQRAELALLRQHVNAIIEEAKKGKEPILIKPEPEELD